MRLPLLNSNCISPRHSQLVAWTTSGSLKQATMQLATHSLTRNCLRSPPPTLLDAVEDEREWRGGEGAAAAAAGESAAEDGEVRSECEEERQRGGGCGCCSGGRLQEGGGRSHAAAAHGRGDGRSGFPSREGRRREGNIPPFPPPVLPGEGEIRRKTDPLSTITRSATATS